MRAIASGVYLLSGKRVTSSLNASNESRAALRVAFGQVLVGELAEQPEVLVEVDQALQVIGVVDVGVVRVQLDEAVAGGDAEAGSPSLVVGVGDLELRLLRVAAVGIARFELLEILDRLRSSRRRHRLLGFGVEALSADQLAVSSSLVVRLQSHPHPASRRPEQPLHYEARFGSWRQVDRAMRKIIAPAAERFDSARAAPDCASTRRWRGCFRSTRAAACRPGCAQGRVLLDARPAADAKRKVWGGERVALADAAGAGEPAARAEAIALAIVHEDDALLVIDKPAGLVVHPGSGNWQGTLLNALLHHAPPLASVPRAGIVHRLDKDTSGLLVVAKTLQAQTDLVRQLAGAHGEAPVPRAGARRGRARRDGRRARSAGIRSQRTRMAVTARGRAARTHYRVRERFDGATLLECTPGDRPHAPDPRAHAARSAIRWSAIRSTAAAQRAPARSRISRARRCMPRAWRWCIRRRGAPMRMGSRRCPRTCARCSRACGDGMRRCTTGSFRTGPRRRRCARWSRRAPVASAAAPIAGLNLGTARRRRPRGGGAQPRDPAQLPPGRPGVAAAGPRHRGRRRRVRGRSSRKPTAPFARTPARVCAVLTADCLPVLLARPARRRRGGSRTPAGAGCAGGVIEATLARMAVPPDELIAWLGPGIGPRPTKSGRDVYEAFVVPDPALAAAFAPRADGKFLRRPVCAGAPAPRGAGALPVYGGGFCTYTDSRASTPIAASATGRMASLIWIDR